MYQSIKKALRHGFNSTCIKATRVSFHGSYVSNLYCILYHVYQSHLYQVCIMFCIIYIKVTCINCIKENIYHVVHLHHGSLYKESKISIPFVSLYHVLVSRKRQQNVFFLYVDTQLDSTQKDTLQNNSVSKIGID